MGSRNVSETHRKHLRDPEVASEYLKDALESGDKAVIGTTLRNIADAYSVEMVQCAVGREFGGPDCEYD